MKKALATVVAVVMLLTMGAMPAFAANKIDTIGEQEGKINVEIVLDSGTVPDIETTDFVALTLTGVSRSSVTLQASPTSKMVAPTAAQIANLIATRGVKPSGISAITASGAKLTISGSDAIFKTTGGITTGLQATIGGVATSITRTAPAVTTVQPYVAGGQLNVNGVRVQDAFMTDANGYPQPYVLDDADLNDVDGVRSNTTVYYVLANEAFGDTDYFKIDVKKATNSKDVASITIGTKNFNNETAYMVGRSTVTQDNRLVGGGRRTVVAVKLKEKYTDAESKINFDFSVKSTSKGQDRYNILSSKTSEKIDNIGTFYVKNEVVKSDDDTIRVGQNGQMIEPVKNEDNTIIWYNNNDDLARLRFRADSDVVKFYSKLSTQWMNEDYDAYFDGQDAFIFRFTGSPKISSTSRADLEIYNPFIDEDEEETIDPDSVVIYEIVDGELINRTDSFSYGENDDGFMAFSTKTRTLGTYILCEEEVDDGIDIDDVESPVVDPSEPSVVPPANNKVPPNTGRYI